MVNLTFTIATIFVLLFRNKKRAEDELAPLNEQSKQMISSKQIYQNNIKAEAEKTQSFSVELNKLDEKSCKFEEAIVKAEGDLKVHNPSVLCSHNLTQ